MVDYNKKEKNYKKLPIVPIIAIFAFVVTLGITFFILSNEKKNDISDEELLVATSTDEVEVPQASIPTPAVINEPQPDTEPVNVTVEQVINYTSVECDEDSLKQLVVDTIQSANVQIEESRLDEVSTTMSVIMDAVDEARKNGELRNTFVPLGDELNPLSEDKQNWTYFEVSGAVGGSLFDGKNPARNVLEQSDLLKNLVAEGVYLFDVEKLEINEVNGTFDMAFVDVETGNYDVNFEVNMLYDGQEWVALVGNVNYAYRVLDVVKAEDLENLLVYTGTKIETHEQNVSSVNDDQNEETVNVSIQEGQEQEITQVPVQQEIYDPYVGAPNYTGPREGYFYDWIEEDYLPINGNNLLIGEDLMGNLPSNEEYDAAGGQHYGY